MQNSNNHEQSDDRLQIGFPSSSEDHRLQLMEINGSIFAILHSPLESDGPICLNCEDWSLILLAPIKSKTNIVISAINIICLNEINTEEGMVNIHASRRLIKFAPLTKGSENICEMGGHSEFQFDDDPGAFLHYYRLFESIVSCVRVNSPDAFSEAQQKVIMGLCTLADKIEANKTDLTLRKVLEIWDIPLLKSRLDLK